VWTEFERKTSTLFLGLLYPLRCTYRGAKRITLIADNYIIHKSELVNRWLAKNKKFRILFQPAYHPWANKIERLWKQRHDTVTRNHRCDPMTQLLESVRRFLDVCKYFPGSEPSLATLE
jgi:putative transposase